MADDFLRFEASFGKLDAAVQEFVARLTQQLEIYQAEGDEVRASQVQARIRAIQEPTSTPGEIQAATTAIEREVAAQRKLIAGDAERLRLLQEQAAAQADLAALQRRLERESLTGIRGVDPRAQAALLAQAPSGLRGGDPAAEAAIIRSTELQAQAAAQAQATARVQAAVDEQVARANQQASTAARAEGKGREAVLAIERQQLEAETARLKVMADQQRMLATYAHQSDVALGAQEAYTLGQRAAAQGGLVSREVRTSVSRGPVGKQAMAGEWTEAERALVRYNVSLGEYDAFAANATLESNALRTSLTRLGVADAEASNQLRRHGALTTEFITALARGETTVSEFGYQIGATIGKFAGWTAAAAATYGVLGAVYEFGKGAVDASSGVQALTRTIENLDRTRASNAITNLSQATNVPVGEASDAIFQFSRTFHSVAESSTVAKLALAAFKLDGVEVAASVRAATAINQQFKTGAEGLVPVFDKLAAGQQKFNARISDMIPLLQRSAGAAKNAGGDLNQLLEIGTIVLRTTQLSGSQVGTALQRSAANYLNPQTVKGQADLNQIQRLGVDTKSGSFTQIFLNAIARSGQLSNAQRAQLAQAFFGTGYGGRIAGVFGGGGASLLPRVQGAFGDAGGTLQVELNRQLGTTKEVMHSFTNELQRLGAAFGNTGVVQGFTTAVHEATGGLGLVRGAFTSFNNLPATAKEIVALGVALRGLSLFVSRTRLGSSFPGLNQVPGFRPSEATTARATLAIGTRGAIQQTEQELASSTARSVGLAQQQLALKQQQLAVEAEISQSGQASLAQLDQSKGYSARILALQRQIDASEAEFVAQQAVLADLKRQQVGLTATRFSGRRFSDPEVLSLNQAVNPSSAAATTGAETGLFAGYLRQRQAAIGASVKQLAAGQGLLTAGIAGQSAAARVLGSSSSRLITASEAGTAAMVAARGAVAGAALRIGTFISALDPLTVGLIGLPLAYGSISSLLEDQANATRVAAQAAGGSIKSIDDLRAAADRWGAAAKASAKAASPGGISGFFADIYQGLEALPSAVLGGDLPKNTFTANAQRSGHQQQIQQQLNILARMYEAEAGAFERDAQAIGSTEKGRRELQAHFLSTLSHYSLFTATVLQNVGDQVQGRGVVDAFRKRLNQAREQGIERSSVSAGPSSYQQEILSGQLLPTIVEKQLQAWDDLSKVFGSGSGTLRKAAAGYAALASKFSNAQDSQTLQAVYAAQQNLVSAVGKNVNDFLHRASLATSDSGERAALSGALGVIEQANADARQGFAAIFKYDAGNLGKLRKDHAAFDELIAQFADQFKSVVDAQLQLMQSEAAVATSTITGISPEADLARQQSTLAGLRAQLTYAQSHHASAQTVNGLQAQVNDAQNALGKQQAANARSIVDAQGRLTQSAVTGISPQADLERARLAVQSARQVLTADQSSGVGEAQLLQDQAAVNDAIHSLNQQIQQRNAQISQDAAGLIQAQGAFAASQTLNPIKQAQDALITDIKVLSTIRPQDYSTIQQYQAALLNQKAKVNQDKRGVTQAIVSQDQATLQFELSTQRISDQQYISGLQQLLKMKRLTLSERQGIQQEIFNTLHQTTVDLNLGNIRTPTSYEVRSAIRGAIRRGRGQGAPHPTGSTTQQTTTINNHIVNNVTVARDSQIRRVTDAVEKGVNAVINQAQSAGVI